MNLHEWGMVYGHSAVVDQVDTVLCCPVCCVVLGVLFNLGF